MRSWQRVDTTPRYTTPTSATNRQTTSFRARKVLLNSRKAGGRFLRLKESIMGKRSAIISSARQTDRRYLQPGLQVLLLPLQGSALPGQPFPHERRTLETYLRQLMDAQQGPEVTIASAGRRADADGTGFLQAAMRAGREV